MNVNQIRYELIRQRDNKVRGNLYHFSQVNFSYNSNKIEGSKLSEEHTRFIFDNGIINGTQDEIEVRNHFDFMLDIIDENLSSEILLKMHKILKKDTKDLAGVFKSDVNVIGVIETIDTVDPDDIDEELSKLIERYESIEHVTLEDIIDFHYEFEIIHSFKDGNGRIGRMIMFKECLRHNIVPFIVLDEFKAFYMRGLKEYKRDKMYLIDTIKYQTDLFIKVVEDLLSVLDDEIINL